MSTGNKTPMYEVQERVGYDEWVVVSDPMPRGRAEATLTAFVAADDGGGEYRLWPAVMPREVS